MIGHKQNIGWRCYPSSTDLNNVQFMSFRCDRAVGRYNTSEIAFATNNAQLCLKNDDHHLSTAGSISALENWVTEGLVCESDPIEALDCESIHND